MDMTELSCRAFADKLASSDPTPGGGGAAALMGAIGAALGGMVAALTVGKPRYAAVEGDLRRLQARCTDLREALLQQVQGDADGFAPLAAAYRIPKDDPQREAALEQASRDACAAPMAVLELCRETLTAVAALEKLGSRLALSDAGCAAACCRAAMESAALNVFINTRQMKNREAAEDFNCRTETLLKEGRFRAEQIYQSVLAALTKEDG